MMASTDKVNSSTHGLGDWKARVSHLAFRYIGRHQRTIFGGISTLKKAVKKAEAHVLRTKSFYIKAMLESVSHFGG